MPTHVLMCSIFTLLCTTTYTPLRIHTLNMFFVFVDLERLVRNPKSSGPSTNCSINVPMIFILETFTGAYGAPEQSRVFLQTVPDCTRQFYKNITQFTGESMVVPSNTPRTRPPINERRKQNIRDTARASPLPPLNR